MFPFYTYRLPPIETLYTSCELEHNYNFLSCRAPTFLRLSLHKALPNCPLRFLKVSIVLLIVWEKSYSKMTEKRQGPTPRVRLREVSVTRELTVLSIIIKNMKNLVKVAKIILNNIYCFFLSFFKLIRHWNFEAIRAVFWSLYGYKKSKLPKPPLVGRSL